MSRGRRVVISSMKVAHLWDRGRRYGKRDIPFNSRTIDQSELIYDRWTKTSTWQHCPWWVPENFLTLLTSFAEDVYEKDALIIVFVGHLDEVIMLEVFARFLAQVAKFWCGLEKYRIFYFLSDHVWSAPSQAELWTEFNRRNWVSVADESPQNELLYRLMHGPQLV